MAVQCISNYSWCSLYTYFDHEKPAAESLWAINRAKLIHDFWQKKNANLFHEIHFNLSKENTIVKFSATSKLSQGIFGLVYILSLAYQIFLLSRGTDKEGIW